MRLKKLLINIALFVLFIFFSSAALQEWKGAEEAPRRQNATARNQTVPEAKPEKRRVPSEIEYRDIIEYNLFSPKRVEFIPNVVVSSSAEEIDQLPATSTKFTLYGIILMDDFKRALISNPAPKPGDPTNLWIKVDDKIGSLKVDDIFQQSIIVSENGKQYKIPLYDRDNPKARAMMPKTESTVTVTNIERTQPAPKVDTKVNAEKEIQSDSEYMDTPFGKVKRNK